MTFATTGVAVRPPGSDNSWPPVGTHVFWKLTQPIADLAAQCDRLRYPNEGTIGDTYHLQRHGDHTPWSAGKTRGLIYAIDVKMPADFQDWLIATCKSNYDTAWIDFWNMNGSQYDDAGARLADSADIGHVHISVKAGHEHDTVTLLTDYATRNERGPATVSTNPYVTMPDDIAVPGLPKGYSRTLDWWVAAQYAHTIELEQKLDELLTLLKAPKA